MKKTLVLTALCSLGILFTSFTHWAVKKSSANSSAEDEIDYAAIAKMESPYYIIIDKSDYELKVFDAEGWYATYPIVFGSKDQGDKLYEGDKRTPNGTFTIVLKKNNPKWGFQMTLDYPTVESIQKFNQRKASGQIPRTARIGDGIAIHSTRPAEEWAVDEYYNWTDGCISVKYSEMNDLYSYIPVGTKVTIQP